MPSEVRETESNDKNPDNQDQNRAPEDDGSEPANDRSKDESKNIVLCSDGTGNRGGKARGTNVWAIFNAVWRQPDGKGRPPPKTQVTFYDDGVGTQKFIVFKILGGAFGWGYSRNIRELYKSLVSAYEPGDSIYLFGFSRGAYTVRGLAGMVLSQGILNRHEFDSAQELENAIKGAFRSYRGNYKSLLTFLLRWIWRKQLEAYEDCKGTRKIHSAKASKNGYKPLRFIGVWDTVDAVGLPFDGLTTALDKIVRFRFPNQTLSKHVGKACHAISIDDERKTFWPVMWNEEEEKEGSDRIEQVWFPGVHSNVGGGYPKDQVAQVALDWMMERADREDLKFYEDVRTQVRETANAHGRLYDSRAGLAAYYRYQPRDIEKICSASKDGKDGKLAKIHLSALRRIARATDDYAPANLPASIKVVGTRDKKIVGTRDKDDDYLVGRMTEALADSAETRPKGFEAVADLVGRRRSLYTCFLAFSLAVAAAAYWSHKNPLPQAQSDPDQAPGWFGLILEFIEWLIPDYLQTLLGPLLDRASHHWGLSLAALTLLFVLAILKSRLESRSRYHALNAWRGFRERVYPP